MSNYFEETYKLYIDSLKENIEENLKKIAEEMNLEYKEQKPNKNTKIPEFGDIFQLFQNKLPIYYLFIEKENDLYKVVKVSEWWRLANQNDMLIEVLGEPFIIETWNTFYLTKEEIENSQFLDTLNEEDKKILKTFLEGKIDQLPQNKRGLTVPEGNYNFYQNKFHKKESEIVRDFALRVFDIIEEDEKSLMATIELPPERLEKQLLAAGEEKTVYRGDNFILFIDEENKIIELEPSEELIGKSVLLKVYDEEYRFENLPEKIKLLIPEKYTGKINIDYIGRNIHIEGK